jgi:ketosteroid isomerase-like protein
MAQENVQTAKDSYEALARGDLDTVLETYHSDIELLPGIPSRGPWRGHDGAAKYLRTLSKNFDELRVEPEEFLAAGDRVVVLGTVHGRASRTAFGTPPADRRSFEIPFAHVLTMREGKVAHFREYFDPLPLLAPEPTCKPAPKPPPKYGGWSSSSPTAAPSVGGGRNQKDR